MSSLLLAVFAGPLETSTSNTSGLFRVQEKCEPRNDAGDDEDRYVVGCLRTPR